MVSGALTFNEALDFLQNTFDAAPMEAQFLFLVGAGASIGFLTGGPIGAAAGAAGGVVAFIAS